MKKINIKSLFIIILTVILLLLNLSRLSNNKKAFNTITNNKASDSFITAKVLKVISSNKLYVEIIDQGMNKKIENQNVKMTGTKEIKGREEKAFAFTKEELEGKIIQLQFDSVSSIKNKNDELLCYVWIDNFLFNKILIETGNCAFDENEKMSEKTRKLFIQAENYSKTNH